jgi:hypothetical protein
MVSRVETSVDEWTWSAQVAYACACGAYGSVTRWRWVDAEANPELAKRLREAGPLEGNCRACQRPAEGGGAWLELSPGQEQATLVLGAQQRGELLEVLQGHLEQLRTRPGQVRHWLLQPRVTFTSARPSAAAPADAHERGAGIPKAVGQRGWASGPTLSAEIQRAVVGDLIVTEGGVTVVAALDEPTRRMWGSAALQARPVLLRGLGYPLLGVRLVASYLGEVAVIDAVVDVSDPSTSEIFVRLTQSFRLRLAVRSDAGPVASREAAVREIEAEALGRNAAMCLESAQGQLGAGEYPPDAYRTARDSLARMSAKQRLEPARHGLTEGSYRHLVSPNEALQAIERLDQASKKDNLARLLEVDGLPVGEYEAIRRAVLAAALEFGLTAPARFWRRILGTELVRDAGEWIQKLVANRSAAIARGDDLSPEQAEQAWRAIFDLCQHHSLSPPPEVTRALGLGRRSDAPRPGVRPGTGASASARVPAADDSRPPSVPMRAAERAPSAPMRAASERAPSAPMRAAAPLRPGSGPSPAAPSAEPARATADTARTAALAEVRGGPAARAGSGVELRGPVEPPRAAASLPRPRRSAQESVAVAGEIGAGAPVGLRGPPPARPPEPPLLVLEQPAVDPPARPAADPKQLARAMAILSGGGPIGEAMAVLPSLEEDDLLAVMPALAELGARVVPELLTLLGSGARPLRQAAAILLGLARDRRAIDPLVALLGAESSAVWIDAAKALGNFGPRVVGPLCALLRGSTGDRREALVGRAARALAELVVSDGDAPGGAGRLAVENLLEVGDPSVSSAARRALATLADVQGEGRGAGMGTEDRVERDIRRFSTRAYEAITTPELDADGDFEVVGDD